MAEVFTGMFWVTTLTKLLALLLGAFIVYLAYKGFRRNRSRPLLYVAAGFALITAGTIMEGVLYVVAGAELLTAIAAGTVVTVLGLVAVIYSIYSAK